MTGIDSKLFLSRLPGFRVLLLLPAFFMGGGLSAVSLNLPFLHPGPDSLKITRDRDAYYRKLMDTGVSDAPLWETHDCQAAQVACSGNVYTYPAGTVGSAPGADSKHYPNYGCLGATYGPAWFYMQVGTAGDIIIRIAKTGGPPMQNDVDFICWGPFASLSDGCASGLTGNGTCNPSGSSICCSNTAPSCVYPKGNIVDCSFDMDSTETCHIPNANVGEIYILLITNYSRTPGTITFSQTGGSGVTNCYIVVHCSMVAITANPTACAEGTNTFSVSGNIEFSNPPPTGTLTITDNTAVPPVSQTFTPPFTSPKPYMLTNIPCDGLTHTLTASFSDSAACFLSTQYTSPQATCPEAVMSGGGTDCNTGISQVPVTVSFPAGVPPITFSYAINGVTQAPVVQNSPGPYQILTKIPGTYTLVSVSGSNCPSGIVSGSATVVMNPLPTATISGSDSACLNDPPPTITFTGGSATPPYTFTFNINGGANQSVSTTAGNSISVFAPTTAPGVFNYNLVSVQESSATSCTQLQAGTATVTVGALPTATVAGTTAVCRNSAEPMVTFTGSGSTPPYTFTYNINGGTSQSVTTTSGSSATVAVPTSTAGVFTYNLLGVQSGSPATCSQSQPGSATVTVNPLPAPSITGLSTVCRGDTKTYQTQAGATNYTWGLPSSGITLVSGGGVNDDQVTVKWNNAGTYTITINYVISTGCTAATPSGFAVTVNALPAPQITGPVPVCMLSSHSYAVTPVTGGHAYSWSVTGGTIQSGQTANTVQVLWGNVSPGGLDLTETVAYPGISCSAPASTFPVTLNPWPGTPGVITGSSSACKTATETYSIPAIADAASYQWFYSGTGVTFTGNGSPAVSITFSPAATNGSLTVKGVNNCGDGPLSAPLDITVHYLPEVSLTPCFDLVTTPNAGKVILRGGAPRVPAQGVYSGSRVSLNTLTGNYEFNPLGAPPGTYAVTYAYTNSFGCTSAAPPVNITVKNNPFSCGGSLKDVRDGKIYATALISGRCWMTENLSYGTALVSPGPPQTDNCLPEKYCSPADAGCSHYGGLYQWDEMMDYASIPGLKGLCPPEWHVPTDAEWQTLIDNLIGGIGAPEANGLSGSYMKDLLMSGGFHALTGGVNYNDNYWAYTSGTFTGTLFWTSTPDGPAHATARGMNFYTQSVSLYYGSRGNAFSLRCVKD